jgi:hypothetical protein
MVAIVMGRINWGLERDQRGHRDYGITWKCRTTHYDDGPATVLLCPDLPQVGSTWQFGNESDPWAHCWPDWTIRPVYTDEIGVYWIVSQTFSTRPLRRCQDSSIEDPLLEPPDISGSFVEFTEEKTKDRHGKPLRNIAFERIRGPLAEFEDSRPNVIIRMNSLYLNLGDMKDYLHHVNDAEMWGLEKRMIKLSRMQWQRQVYGVCNYYFTSTYEFDINFNTFDKEYTHSGKRCLRGWSQGTYEEAPANPDLIDGATGLPLYKLPRMYEYHRDVSEEIVETDLDSKGRPVAISGEDTYETQIEYYDEANLLELGIPAFW